MEYPREVTFDEIKIDHGVLTKYKSRIYSEQFVQCGILQTFDLLGEVDQSETREWSSVNKETKQYITYASLKQNMPRVF